MRLNNEPTPKMPYELELQSIKYRMNQLKTRLALLSEEYQQILTRRQKEYGGDK